MKAIIKRPYEPVGRLIEISNTLEALQQEVGGYIECLTVASDMAIICDEEGRLKSKPYNCEVCGINFVGVILAVGVDDDEFTDVPIDLTTWEGMLDD